MLDISMHFWYNIYPVHSSLWCLMKNVEANLTDHQQRALRNRIKKQRGRYFSGISEQEIARSFSRINELREAGCDQATTREIELFEICDYKP